jgi:pimeloyl-ACP methyl ester carboxylesterase
VTRLYVRGVSATAPVSGPPVLLVHGLASRGRVDWPDAEWAGPLSAAGRDALVVDLPAHGRSDRPQAPMSAADIVDLLSEVVHDAGGAVDVIGYSLGARLAWALAARGSVRRAVLGGLEPVDLLRRVDLDAARAAIAGGPEPTDTLTQAVARMARLPGLEPAAVLDLVQGIAADPFDPRADAPKIPVLLLAGEDDPVVRGLEGLATALPDARILRVPGDHLTALHAPEFRAAAFDFLGL